MALLTLDHLLGQIKGRVQRVPVPGWDGVEVYVRPLTSADRLAIIGSWDDSDKARSAVVSAAMTISRVLCDEHGQRLFTGSVDELLDALPIDRFDALYQVCAGSAGLLAGQAQDLEGNLSAAPTSSS